MLDLGESPFVASNTYGGSKGEAGESFLASTYMLALSAFQTVWNVFGDQPFSCEKEHGFTAQPHQSKYGLKVPCAPQKFSNSFSYSTCTTDIGAVTHNERRFQLRFFNHLFRIVPGFMGKSRINRW